MKIGLVLISVGILLVVAGKDVLAGKTVTATYQLSVTIPEHVVIKNPEMYPSENYPREPKDLKRNLAPQSNYAEVIIEKLVRDNQSVQVETLVAR